MLKSPVQTKWDQIYAQSPALELVPARVLAENAHLLPSGGDALDLACGLGGNALFLAKRGFRVSAWDISTVAVGRLDAVAQNLGLTVAAETRDIETEPFPCETFDVLVVSRFLARHLAKPIIDSLKPGGILFYQTYLRAKLNPKGPNNPDYLLQSNELLALFNGLRLLVYREEERVGDLSVGWRDEAYLVGLKKL